MSDQKQVIGIVAEDPLGSSFPIGGTIEFQLINFGSSNAVELAKAVINWDFFKGAVVAFVLKSEASHDLVGTAIIVAPGLAITATHNFVDVVDKLQKGTVIPYCFGIREREMNIWQVTSVSFDHGDDIALLAIKAASNTPGW
jgi:hypothetical protein